MRTLALVVAAVLLLAAPAAFAAQPAPQRYVVGAPNFFLHVAGLNLGGVEFEGPAAGFTTVTVVADDDFAPRVSLTVCQNQVANATFCDGPRASNCDVVTITGLRAGWPVNVWINSVASGVQCGDLPATRGTVSATYS